MLDVDLVEIEQNVPEDYEPTDDATVDGSVIRSSETPLSRDELADTDEYGPVYDDDDIISASRPAGDVAIDRPIVVTPDPAPPRGTSR